MPLSVITLKAHNEFVSQCEAKSVSMLIKNIASPHLLSCGSV